MENNLTLESIEEEKSSLPHLAFIIMIFFTLSGLISYAYFKDIVLISEGRLEDFEFQKFLIYNFGLKVVLFPFKFIGMILVFMMGAFLFKVENLNFVSLLKVVVLAELIKYLPEISKILWFSFVAADSLEGYDLATFSDYFSLNGLLEITKENAIHSLLDYFSIVQLCYVLGVAKLLQMELGSDFSYHLRWSGLTYCSFTFIMGLVSTLISL